MQDTYYALSSVWNACTSWFNQVKNATGIPIFEILIAFASLGIIFKLLVFPFIGYSSEEASSTISKLNSERKNKQNTAKFNYSNSRNKTSRQITKR